MFTNRNVSMLVFKTISAPPYHLLEFLNQVEDEASVTVEDDVEHLKGGLQALYK